jgi:thioredoxin reductase (NADPH)
MTGPPEYSSTVLDCLIIGGGPAGLTAATYLARFLRSVQIIDGGNPRLSWIPKSHNYPGVPEGMHGKDALHHMRSQVALYKIPVLTDHVLQLQRQENGDFLAATKSGKQIRSRTVLLCTGVVDIEPQFEGVKQALAESVLRYCPICDGYEAINKKTVVLGFSKGGLGEALFVRHYTPYITLLTLGMQMKLTPQEQEKLKKANIRVFEDPVVDAFYQEKDKAISIRFQNGQVESFDVMYSALGTRVNSELADQVGATLDEDGKVNVNAHMQTSVPGLYAAGDIVVGLNQIAVAMGQAAIASTAIHNSLNTWHN